MKPTLVSFALVLLACTLAPAGEAQKAPKSVYDFTLDDIDGKPYALDQHKGQVLLIVNVASKCGFTPQYEALEALYTKYHEKGLTVIGVPSNDFGGQEPLANLEIKAFCTSRFHVTFPMLAKSEVIGERICPLYKYLTAQGSAPGAVTWNFNKFLIDRNGKVIERFDSKVKPDDKNLIEAVEKALAETAK